jgi:hypothetical protein
VNSPPRARLKAAAARKDELEEIFQVLLQSPRLPELPQRMEGVLVTNGHTNPHVEPRMTGWFKDNTKRMDDALALCTWMGWWTGSWKVGS